MATHAPITGAPKRALSIPAPPAAITRALARFDRDQLAGFIAVAIDLLDLAEGDTDTEANGDELDGTDAEDDFHPHIDGRGEPGCPVSDSDCCSAGDDTGTDHVSRLKLGFDVGHAILDEDAEDGHDRESDPAR